MGESTKLNAEIDEVRGLYSQVSLRGSILYFVVKDLSLIDPMYQYSLQYIMKLFEWTIQSSEKTSVLERRLRTLIDNITNKVYTDVTRGLFEQHKLIYSTLIAVAINRKKKVINLDLWNVLLRGPGSVDKDKKDLNPSS